MKLALVHDYLNQSGGAERVLKALCELFPEAPIFTLFYDKKKTNKEFEKRNIVTSFLDKIPLVSARHHFFPYIMPFGVESLDLRSYDCIVSDSGSFGKGIITSPHAIHISYCHTPSRFLWDGSQEYLASSRLPFFALTLAPFALTYLRLWDIDASKRVDYFLANSSFIAERIKKYYKRDARILYPPVEVKKFGQTQWRKSDYYLVLMRLVSYKRLDIVIKTFNELGLPLKIVGDGPLRRSLEKRARSNIEFVGHVPHENIAEYYGRAKALIFPQEEDFGISAVEAIAVGTPVIAYKSGGALEIIEEGKNGLFFPTQTAGALFRAIKIFQKMIFNDTIIKASGERFDESVFKEKFMGFLRLLTPNS